MAKPNPSKGNETSKEYLNSLNNNSKRQATNCTNEFVNTQDRENKAGENSDAASTTLNVSPKISFAESSVLRSPHQPSNKDTDTDTPNNVSQSSQLNDSSSLPAKKPMTNKELAKQKEAIRICMFMGLVLVIALSSIIRFYARSESTDQVKQKPVVPANEQLLRLNSLLQKEFPNQNKKFISTILSSFDESIITSGNPSIVMLVSDDNAPIGHCVANRIFKVLGDKKVPELDCNNLQLLNKDQAKLEIDNQLENAFKAGKRLFLINNIEAVPSSSMFIFYTYGDSIPEAKFPGVMIFFTYKLKSSLTNEQRKLFRNGLPQLTSFVEQELTELWNDIHFDQLKPLFTRITNNVVLVEKDEQPCNRDEL